MSEAQRKSEEEWRQLLTADQYHVCRQGGTERAFTGEYWDCKNDGIYRCVCCRNELFSSETKFDSGTGWPSFHTPLAPDRVTESEDVAMGMRRVEIRCGACDAHLGHVFDDGPEPTGKRYCMNSVALSLDSE